MNDLVLFALKDEAPNLFKEYSNVHCIGVGKVNAAIHTMRLCNLYHPRRIINLGTAGGISLGHGIHRINTAWQHDVNLMALGMQPGIHFNDPESMIIMPGEGKTCASGDMFITEPNKLRVECDVVDMEAYSVAKVANLTLKCGNTLATQQMQAQEKLGKNKWPLANRSIDKC
jgi:adenosylhomocysteine nucleosidase